MKYKNIYKARFIDRPNRFIANVEIAGKKEKVHVKNTGRCKEILKKGTEVYLERSDNPNRKTRYSLISAYKGPMLINLDSQVPNQVIYDAILANQIAGLENLDFLKKEVSFKNSRFDLYYEKNDKKGFIEVKGVTLEKDGTAIFPDAPTERGRKHIYELIDSLKEDYISYLIFLIQINNIKRFKANSKTDPDFAQALNLAYEKGIKILAYNSLVTKNSIKINKRADLIL